MTLNYIINIMFDIMALRRTPTMIILSTLMVLISSNAVDLYKVTALNVNAGQGTTFRQTQSYPQLSCVSGDRSQSYLINSVQCVNKGWNDNGDVQW